MSSRTPASSDHPRSRGVYVRPSSTLPPGSGSSPLARGLRAGAAGPAWPGRIIPARAGFTDGSALVGQDGRDHPRSRGVYGSPRRATPPTPGSSPLARGLLMSVHTTMNGMRIIPARAGFTHLRSRNDGRRKDHPRSRGVYGMTDVAREAATGSSPLARGLRLAGRDGHPHAGIIPARAGFTGASKRNWRPRGDHPRSRGVYRHDGGAEDATRGSSPLARGLRGDPVVFGGGAGIIPARAGFTARARKQTCTGRDHPRSRGVYRPRPRGGPARCWIIPARAGFTDDAIPVDADGWDHPRSRGVYSPPGSGGWRAAGSSPLARGLRSAWASPPSDSGIIPARAGFTRGRRTLLGGARDHPRSRGVYLRRRSS